LVMWCLYSRLFEDDEAFTMDERESRQRMRNEVRERKHKDKLIYPSDVPALLEGNIDHVFDLEDIDKKTSLLESLLKNWMVCISSYFLLGCVLYLVGLCH